MGTVMRWSLALLAMLALAPAARADDAKLFKAGSGGAIILSTVAEMMVATGMCSLGDREDWQKVVAAVDRRYRFCVAKDPAWSGLMEDFKPAEAKAKTEGSSRSWGSFAIESLLGTRAAEARAMGMMAYCAKMPWKLILVPGAATDEAKAEYMKANPQATTLEQGLAFFSYIRDLGSNTAWVEAPCDKDFWPEFK
jgi:hypothetical protein